MRLLVPAALAVAGSLFLSQARGATEDIPLGALPADAVKGVMQKTLSPTGRFVILIANGTVRVMDAPANIEQARKALTALETGPALVSFGFIIKTGMHKVTKVSSTAPQAEFPVPETYAPPQVIGYGRRYVVVPATPTSFTMQPLGVTETVTNVEITGGTPRQFAGSTLFPKPVAVTACAKVPDPAGLHDWAVANGAAPKDEPAWAAARTEILVTPERADNGMVLTLQPQVVVAGANGEPRVIPLRVCTASTIVKQGASVTLEGFPGADPDFYRLFLGAQESTGDAISSITIGAAFDYTMAQQRQILQPAPMQQQAQPQGQPQGQLQPPVQVQPQAQAQPVQAQPQAVQVQQQQSLPGQSLQVRPQVQPDQVQIDFDISD